MRIAPSDYRPCADCGDLCRGRAVPSRCRGCWRTHRRLVSQAAQDSRFDSRWEPEPNSGCWLWTGLVWPNGYAHFTVGRTHVYAHRFSYERSRSPIPAGLSLDHLCRVRCCVNPDHLEPVTQRENTLRGNSPVAIQARQTTCKRGHSLTDPCNLLKSYPNIRRCRECHRLRMAARYVHRRPGMAQCA